jgi:SPP1 gp7 family putative phage head morphogenesis protein
MDVTFSIQAPHAEAAALIKGKPVVTRRVFDGLLPELRGRAYTITGVEAANVLQRTRDTIAGLAEGSTWDAAKKDLIAELDPYLGDGAEQRAEILLRTHAFQAFSAADHRTIMDDEDTTHCQYLSMEDDHVRESHAALNGIILPKDDPFWDTHTGPWDWGCRCKKRGLNVDQVAEEQQTDLAEAPENRNVLGPAARRQLNDGTLLRDGQRFDVSPPEATADNPRPFRFNPDDLRLPLDQLEARYDPPVWNQFVAWAKSQKLGGTVQLWDWLNA